MCLVDANHWDVAEEKPCAPLNSGLEPSLGRPLRLSQHPALLAVRADSPFPYGVRHEDKMRIGDRLAGAAAALDEENIFAKQHRAASAAKPSS